MSTWMVLPSTCPNSTAPREIAIVRKRAMMPSCMSIAMAIAAPPHPPPMVIAMTPGTTYSRYAACPSPAPFGSPAPIAPPKTYTNPSRNSTGTTITNSDRPG